MSAYYGSSIFFFRAITDEFVSTLTGVVAFVTSPSRPRRTQPPQATVSDEGRRRVLLVVGLIIQLATAPLDECWFLIYDRRAVKESDGSDIL